MAEFLENVDMFYKKYEPKVAFRFYMEMAGIPAWIVKASGTPNVTFDEVLIEHINIRRKLKGKPTWNDIQVILYDPIVPSGAQAVMEWIRLSHEATTGRDGYAEMYKKDVTFYSLGPVGDKVSEWTLKGCWIAESNFGDYDWSNTSDAINITLSLKYDYAVLRY